MCRAEETGRVVGGHVHDEKRGLEEEGGNRRVEILERMAQGLLVGCEDAGEERRKDR